MDIDKLIVEKFGIEDVSSLPFKATRGSREQLAEFFGEIGFKVGAEVGVRAGGFSYRLCRNIPGLKLKCIDPWRGFRRNEAYQMDDYMERARKLMEPYNAELIRKLGVDAVRDVPNDSLDFVYIDAMHEFDSVMVDIITWSPKVKRGGIVSGHDYTPASWCNGVILAVQSYVSAHGIKNWYITKSSRGNGEIEPSFFWVRR